MVKLKYGLLVLLGLTSALFASSQELFVLTEPASNMPSHAIGIRAMNSFMKQKAGGTNFHTMPEIMYGVNHKLMLHVQGFASTRFNGDLVWEGASLYAKYRWYSVDDVHEHFRLASYVRLSSNKADIHQQEIETMGHNSGVEIGAIATKLKDKVATGGSISLEKALNNGRANKFPSNQSSLATNYTFSIGKLIYPKTYTSLKQTNINLMLEFLGQYLNNRGTSFLDVAPSVQFIFNSQARVDVAWRQQIYSSMQRTAANGLIIKLEYTFFNVFN
jgi:hypothetical protein